MTLFNEKEKTQVTATKTWENTPEGELPTVYFKLYSQDGANADVIPVQGAELKELAPGTTSVTWNNLPTHSDNGNEYIYSVRETDASGVEGAPEGYTSSINPDNSFNIINTYTAETEISVQKVWDDSGNRAGVQPSIVQVQLTKNGQDHLDAVPLYAGNNWSHKWTNLPEVENGQVVQYGVKEINVPAGYTSDVTEGTEPGTFVVTNTYTPETREITGQKTWEDNDDQDGERPEEITVNLLADGVEVDDQVVTADDDWTYTFTGLPIHKEGAVGQEIVYTVTEEIVDDYNPTITGFNITNTKTPNETSATVTKSWQDGNNQDGNRPAYVEVQLLANGTAVGDPIVLRAENNWTHTWIGLPENAGGQAITYTVSEITATEGYEVVYDFENQGNMTITNTYTPETIDISGEKIWDDAENQDGKRPDSVTINLLADGSPEQSVTASAEGNWAYSFTDLPKFADGEEIIYTVTENSVDEYITTYDGYDVINSYEPGLTTATVTKNWDDNNDQDGIRPEIIEVQLTAGGEVVGQVESLHANNNWSFTWSELPAYSDGELIEYSVVEVTDVADYDEPLINDDDHGNMIITNSHTPSIISIDGTKTWNDEGNQDGIRPDSVTVHLNNGTTNIRTETVTPDEAGNWTYTFENLPEFADGSPINYTVVEDAPEGYVPVYNGFDIVNTRTPDVTEVSVEKVWDDAGNQDSIRPPYISAQLYADGEESGLPVTLYANNNWTYTWENLALNSDGTEVEYTVVELGVHEAYETSTEETEDDYFTITNSYTPQVIELSGTKTWDDADNQDGIRPTSITVNLLDVDEAIVATQTVEPDAEGHWNYTFTGIPMYKPGAVGELGVYSVEEVPVAEYTSAVSEDGLDLTNTHIPYVQDITVTKAWDDVDNEEGFRPEEVTFQLLTNGDAIEEPVTVTEADDWTYTWIDLDVNEAGEPIVYTVAEINIRQGYIVSVDDEDSTNIVITNSLEPRVSVGDYVWIDENRDGLQDETDTPLAGVVLTIVDETGQPVVDIFGNPVGPQTTDENGLYSFDNLPINHTYTVTIDQEASAPALEGLVPTLKNVGDNREIDSSTWTATSEELTEDGQRDPSLDFGFYVPSVSVGDYVWIDENRDGLQDETDTPLAGVVLTIVDETGQPVIDVFGNLVGPQTTDADGHYSFDDLPINHTYTVTIDQEASAAALEGLVPTLKNVGDNREIDSSTWTATSEELTENGQRDPSLDFGFYLPSVSVGDYVWIDENRDGLQDETDTPLAGVVLTIVDETGQPVVDVFGNPVGPQTTDADGHYSFDDLPINHTYTVTIDQDASAVALEGLVPTLENDGDNREIDSSTWTATSVPMVEHEQRDPSLDFGFYVPSVSVGDYVWIDENRDGLQDETDTPLAGVVLTIVDETGQPVIDVFGNPVGPQTTDADGHYSFDNLPINHTYTVTIDQDASAEALEGLVPTLENVGDNREIDSSTWTATSVPMVKHEQRDPSLDFGFYVPSVSVGDYVWIDENRDGLQDETDTPLAGVVLTIVDETGQPVVDVFGNPVGPQTTDADGHYSFDDLPINHTYTVTIDQDASAEALEGLVPTLENVGDNREIDSSTWTATSVPMVKHEQRDPSLDFGFYVPSVSVGDFVWFDINKDGLQDEDEPGIPNVTLRIVDGEGNPVTDIFGDPVEPVMTDANGYYNFGDLPVNNTYTVIIEEDDPELEKYLPTLNEVGDDNTIDSSTWTSTSRELTEDEEHDPTLDFGFFIPSVSVGDFVWFDEDKDGIQDEGEPGIPGVVLEIQDENGDPVTDIYGEPVGPVTTDENGKYIFENLPIDKTYTVTISPEQPALEGYEPTLPEQGDDPAVDSSTWEATSVPMVEDEQHDPTLDFGFFIPSVSVGDKVWFDKNKDGIQDEGEPGIPGVVLEIQDENGDPVTDIYGEPVGPVTTDENGKYIFENLPIDKIYTVTISPEQPALDGYEPTLPEQGADPAVDSSTWEATSVPMVEDEQHDPTLDFGFFIPSVSVGDYVWIDVNKDGLQDATDTPLAGVVLTIVDETGEPVVDIFGNSVEAQTTDENGHYSFDNLPINHTYTVSIDQEASSEALDGLVPTLENVGDDPAVDSSTWIATSVPMVEDEQHDPTLDFGFFIPSVSVGDFVWFDEDKDGIQDEGEPGIPGVVLEIRDENGDPVTDINGEPVGPVTTDENGKYIFENLPIDKTYTVTISPEQPALDGYEPTLPEQGDNPGLDSSTWEATSVPMVEDEQHDPTLDFGFFIPSVSVGDYVWIDVNKDGLQDATDTPLAGVVLMLVDETGGPVVDIFGNPVGPQTTDENGYYAFTNLPINHTYTVTIDQEASADALAGLVPTLENVGDNPAIDSSTWSATSVEMTEDGQHDPTLDFGFHALEEPVDPEEPKDPVKPADPKDPDGSLPATGEAPMFVGIAVLILLTGISLVYVDRRRS